MTTPASPLFVKHARFLNSPLLILNLLWLYIPPVYLQGLYVEVDIRAVAEVATQLLLYVGGAAVGLVEGQVAGHTQVHLYRYAVAYAARTQVVYAAYASLGLGYFLDFALYVVGKALFKKFV